MNLKQDYPRHEDETESEYKKRAKLEHEIDHKYGISLQQRRDRAHRTGFDDSHIKKTLPYAVIVATALVACLISYFGGIGNARIEKHLWGQLVCAIVSMIVFNNTDEVLIKETKVARTLYGGAFALITYVLVGAISMDILNQLKA